MEQPTTPDAAPAPTSLLTTRASNPPKRASPTQPADTASPQSDRRCIGGAPSGSTPLCLAAEHRAAEELHAAARRTVDRGQHEPGECRFEMRNAAPRQEVFVRPRKWAVGGRHQQNYVSLGWKWNHRVAAKMHKDAQKKRDEKEKKDAEEKEKRNAKDKEKKDAEEKKKGVENPAAAPQPGHATLGVSTTSHIVEVKDGVITVDGAQDGSVTQATGMDNVDGKEPKKVEGKGSKVTKETAFSKLKRVASSLVG